MDEVEIEFQTYAGVQYDLQETSDFINWSTIATKNGDGSKQSVVRQVLSGQTRSYRLLQKFSGMEPLYFRAIVAWDGSGITLEWNAAIAPESGADPNLRYNLVKNGVTPGYPLPLTVTEFHDSSVSSGQTYTYSLPIHS